MKILLKIVTWFIIHLIGFLNIGFSQTLLDCGTDFSPLPPINSITTSCAHSSLAFVNRYQRLETWIPHESDKPKIVQISFNIINDINGNGSFTSNSADDDYVKQREYLTKTLPGWVGGIYSRNGSLSLDNGQTSMCSDCMPGVVNLTETKIRFDLGPPGQERIYYYNSALWNSHDRGNAGGNLFNLILADQNRTDQHTTLNIFLTQATEPNIGGYARLPVIGDFNRDLLIVTYGSFGVYDRPDGPDFQTARTLVHELGHAVGSLGHTYDQGQCVNDFDYWDDVFGSFPPAICPSLPAQTCPDAYLSPNDGCTNNIMGGLIDPCYFSPKQIGQYHKFLTLGTSRRYLKDCVYNSISYNVTTNEIWDFDVQFDRDIIVSNNSTLEIQCIVSMPTNSEIKVEAGSTLIVNGIITNNCNGGWSGTIRVKPQATIVLRPNSEIFLNGSGTIIVEDHASNPGRMIYEAGAHIFLNDYNSTINILGLLQLNDNANFTFHHSGQKHGYVKFGNTSRFPSDNITTGNNCSMTFNGITRNRRVLEVNQESLYPPANLISFTINNGTVALNSDTRINPLGLATSINLTSARLTSMVFGINNAHRGIALFGQANVTVNNSVFEFGKYGIFAFLTYGGTALNISNSLFRNCVYGIMSQDKGINLSSCRFISNTYGWYAQSMTFPSSSKNDIVGGVSSANRNHFGYLYSGNSIGTLTIENPNISFNNTGTHVWGTSENIYCGTISNNNNDGIFLGMFGALHMDPSVSPGGGANNVTVRNNLRSINCYYCSNIYINGGFNDLIPKNSSTRSAITGYGMLIPNGFNLLSNSNKWNVSGGFSLLDYNLTSLFFNSPVTIIDNNPLNSSSSVLCGQAVPSCNDCIPSLASLIQNCSSCESINTVNFPDTRLDIASGFSINKTKEIIPNNYFKAVDLFTQILSHNYENINADEKYLLDYNYLKMMEALGNAYKSGQITNEFGDTSLVFIHDSLTTKVVNILSKLIVESVINDDYLNRYRLSMDKVQLYRLAERRDLAVLLLDTISTWVHTDELGDFNKRACEVNLEVDALNGTISKSEILETFISCHQSEIDSNLIVNCSLDYDRSESAIYSENSFIDVLNNIESISVINDSVDIVYRAGNSIELKPGYEAKKGGSFRAFIQGCDTLNSYNHFRKGDFIVEDNVEDVERSLQISVYPNPNFGSFHVILNGAENNLKDIIIYNLLGEKIFEKQKVSFHAIDIDISNREKGIYFVKVISNKCESVAKIILM